MTKSVSNTLIVILAMWLLGHTNLTQEMITYTKGLGIGITALLSALNLLTYHSLKQKIRPVLITKLENTQLWYSSKMVGKSAISLNIVLLLFLVRDSSALEV